VGNSRGELQNYDEDGKLRWSKNAHDGEILNLRFDLTNRFIISLGTDGLILFWPERSAFNEN
jgi:WD40 repeat protein